MISLIKTYHDSKPLLGICLGHQAIGEAFAPKWSKHQPLCTASNRALRIRKRRIQNLPRRHDCHALSLAGHWASDPSYNLRCWLKQRDHHGDPASTKPIVGLQFHPESMGTNEGHFYPTVSWTHSRKLSKSSKWKGGTFMEAVKIQQPQQITQQLLMAVI